MRLILVRHAKAEDREKWGDRDDLKRPLTKKGKKQAKKIAEYIAKKYPSVDVIISSVAKRTCATAKQITKLQSNAAFFLSPHVNPDRGAEGIMLHKDEMRDNWQTIVIIGHEPAISDVIHLLCAKTRDFEFKIGKGAIAELERTNEGSWRLVGLINH